MAEIQTKPRQPRRGIYILPTLFTIGTIFCGFYAVINTMKGEFDLAAMALGFAVVCDGLDGRIARLTNSRQFGVRWIH
jgi:CDP-diacylglycerol--serine O-phosphatidyltransferase